MKLIFPLLIALSLSCTVSKSIEPAAADLMTPPVTDAQPAAGKRVRLVHKDYAGTEIYHLLYLPTDWQKGKKYPVIFEYAGNRWKNGSGSIEECDLGYGITAGQGVIWVCLPCVDKRSGKNASKWWGNVESTVDYCKKTVAQVCNEYGGDPANLFIAGFSRGSIACNYIGLHDPEIAALWKGFICHSHYDGVRFWGYHGGDRPAALERIKRLGDRPQFISHESSVEETRTYLQEIYPGGNFTFQSLSTAEHTDTWVLYDIPERRVLRNWFKKVVEN